MGRQLHVRIRDRHWAVLHSDVAEPVALFDRREDAVKAAKQIASEHGAEVVVFGLDERPLDGGPPSAT